MAATNTTTNGAPAAKGTQKKPKAKPKVPPAAKAAAPAASAPAPAPAGDGATVDLPTEADIQLAEGCLPSNRKHPIRSVSAKLVDTYSTPAFQQGLTGLTPVLASYKGCADITGALDAATKGKILVGTFTRLQNATNRVGQAIIQINQQLQLLDTALGRAQTTAAPDTPVAKGLASLAKLRGAAISQKKGKRTKNKNKKKKAPKA